MPRRRRRAPHRRKRSRLRELAEPLRRCGRGGDRPGAPARLRPVLVRGRPHPADRSSPRGDRGGDFSGHVDVENRDELGALAANVNRTNDELRRVYSELEETSRHKSEFLASMSHELRTPLNAIIGFSEVLREEMFGPVNEKQAEYLDDIVSSGNHLLSLINDVLDLSKVEAGQVELEVGPFSLREALERGVVMVREQATERGSRSSCRPDRRSTSSRATSVGLSRSSSTCCRTP